MEYRDSRIMNGIHLYAALVLCLLFDRDQAVDSIQVSHQNAIKRCQSSGGLAPSKYFNPVPGTVSYPPDFGEKHDDLSDLNLKDGESAWVAGFVSYTLPVVFKDCVAWTENTAREANGTSIFSCLNSCGYTTSNTGSYIGVNSRFCVCLTRDVANANRVRCDQTNDTLFAVYEVQIESVKDDFLYQCNTMQMNTSTAKCTEKHSSVCNTINQDECINKNRHYLVNDSRKLFCIVAETRTWLDSVNHCKHISGIILPDVMPHLVSEVNARVNDTISSWVGTFRSFTVVDDRTGNRPCLVVTRLNNELVLEPEDCNKRRKYVCFENVRRKHGNNKIETTTFGNTASDISDTVEDNVHNGMVNTTEHTRFVKTFIDSNNTVDDNGYNRMDTKIETTTIGKTTSDISNTVEDNVHNDMYNAIKPTTIGKTTIDSNDTADDNAHNRTHILDDKNEIDSNSLIIGIVIAVGAIVALFGITFFVLSIRKICNKTQTSIIKDSAKESHELYPVEGEQNVIEIRDSYVVLDPEPLNGEEKSQSCDGKDKTTIKKAEYDDDSSPIWLHNNPKDNLNTDLYSYAQIGHDHVSDGYDICSSASRFRKTGATSNNYDKMDLRD